MYKKLKNIDTEVKLSFAPLAIQQYRTKVEAMLSFADISENMTKSSSIKAIRKSRNKSRISINSGTSRM